MLGRAISLIVVLEFGTISLNDVPVLYLKGVLYFGKFEPNSDILSDRSARAGYGD
jgi:hypothetical protein